MSPLICATVTAGTTAELRRRRDAIAAAGLADMVELRLDSVADPDAVGALAGRTLPVVVTCRPAWEGGAFTGSEEDRRRILGAALEAGAEHVDVEFRAGFTDLVRDGGRRIVLSTHDFDGVPADLAARVAAMREATTGVVKVAVTAGGLADCLPLLALSRAAGREARRSVWIGMGLSGLATRVLAARFGSCWMYAGEETAPGQIPARRLIEEFGFRRLTSDTHVYGVVGSPVGHSISPAVHNAAFRAAGRDAVYLPFEAADVEDFARIVPALGVRGASVTIPFKVPFFARLAASGDEGALDRLSRSTRAINTLRITDGRWEGRNTDVAGFLAPLKGRIPLEGAQAVVLGAGGAARAVAVALASAGARVTIHARTIERARQVARLVGGQAEPMPPPRGSWDLLVNATPVGMAPRADETPWPGATFDGELVYDLVYNPGETRLLREAAAAGCVTIGGLDMLVAQAQEQAAWWTGVRPPAALLREAALRALGTREAAETAERS
jgi:3-dehydroquinate dehydratase/shikimate dehydrogenase